MKKNIYVFLLLAALLPSICFADLSMPCKKIEYAKLKDSSKSELNSEHCDSLARATFNDSVKQLARTQKELEDRGSAQISCLEAADDAASMLLKKFKLSPKCKS